MEFIHTTPEGKDYRNAYDHLTRVYTLSEVDRDGLRFVVLRDEKGNEYNCDQRLPGSLLPDAASVVERQQSDSTPPADRQLIARFVCAGEAQ
jgi:hypothetical protein